MQRTRLLLRIVKNRKIWYKATVNWADNFVFGISSSDIGFACSLSIEQEIWSKGKTRMTLGHPVKSFAGYLRGLLSSVLWVKPNLVCLCVFCLDKCLLQFHLYIFLFVAPSLFCSLSVGCGDSIPGRLCSSGEKYAEMLIYFWQNKGCNKQHYAKEKMANNILWMMMKISRLSAVWKVMCRSVLC